MTKNSREGLDYGYNHLNLLGNVKSGSTVKAQYRWLADGTKAGVRNGTTGTQGYEYLGSLVYKRTGASTFALESAGFGGGRIVKTTSGYEANYQIVDHLGSVRVVFKDKSNVLARNDFYAFGKRHVNSSLAAGADDLNRFLYNGKEKLITGAVNFLDYGARPYDPEIARWFNPDPLAEKYYSWSPYVYTANNPVRYIDPDGMRVDDYYNSMNGKYLGTDGAATSNMRLINEQTFQSVSSRYNGITGQDATSALQSSSAIITVNEGQIQSSIQSVADNSRSSGLEHSTIITLDRESASISAVAGPTGINDNTTIEYYPAPATGASFYGKPGGMIIIGQVHGHPASSVPNAITLKTMSGLDVNVSTSMQIPIYGIDAMSGRQGSPANLHRANPNGTIDRKIGTTQTFNVGRNAMEIWGRSYKPTY